MTNKQNVLEIIRFGSPERVMSWPPEYALTYHGCDHEGYQGGGHHLPVGSKWTDIWGTEWHKEHADVMGFPRGNPLAEVSALKTYRWPDPNDERICGKIERMAAEFPGGDRFLAGRNRDTLWEKAYMLVGMENMMVYFYTEPEFVREVLHRIIDFQLGIAAYYVAHGIELAHLGDDLGTQHSLILSPAVIREFLVPEYRRLFEFYKHHGVLIDFHSCGHVEPVLDLFMELGVDILNPLQATANDLSSVRRRTQGKMALSGGISTNTMMEGPAERIRSEVRSAIRLLGAQGGYFCTPDQDMPWPEEHFKAYLDALDEFGKYPVD